MLKNYIAVLFVCCIVFVSLNCHTSQEPLETKGIITGSVNSAGPGELKPVFPAYIFCGDSLLVSTDEFGNFTIASLQQGTCTLTCSALNYRDTIRNVQVTGGKTTVHNFILQPDSLTGRVYGEFQDMTLFTDSLQTNPSLKDWDAVQIFDDVTGATLQAKTLRYEVPNRYIFLSDSLVALSDGFAQYWFEIQQGTYLLRGACERYLDAEKVVTVLPGKKQYVNFYLHREADQAISKSQFTGN